MDMDLPQDYNPNSPGIVWNNGAGWVKNNINPIISIKDNSTGLFVTHDAAVGTGVIASGQSFWVQSSNVGATLTVNEAAKIVSGGADSFYKLPDPLVDQIEILLTKSTTGTTDKATISLKAGSSQAYDSFDAFTANDFESVDKVEIS